MLQRFAMANVLLLASENGTSTNLTRAAEWIVVDRLDQGRQILVSDSDTLDLNDAPTKAPETLTRRNTLVGALAFQSSPVDTTYTLLLELPDDALGPSQGNFFAALGFVRLIDQGPDDLKLTGCGLVIRSATPLLWHFDAKRVPWDGDVFQ